MSENLETNSNLGGTEKQFVLFQPRCGHHRYKTSINKGSLGASSVHHASPGILPHGAGGNASERRFFIVFLLLDLVTKTVLFLFVVD